MKTMMVLGFVALLVGASAVLVPSAAADPLVDPVCIDTNGKIIDASGCILPPCGKYQVGPLYASTNPCHWG